MDGKRRINRVFPKDQRERDIASMAAMRRYGRTYGQCARAFNRDVSNTRKQIIAWEKANAEGRKGIAIMRNDFAEPVPMEQGAGGGEVSNS